MMLNKRGDMSIWTVISIVLAVIVLSLLIYGVTTGTVPLFGTIENAGGGGVNVQQVVDSCEIACQTQSDFDYCGKLREVTFTQGADPVRLTCGQLDGSDRANILVLNSNNEKVSATGLVPDVGLPTCNDIVIPTCAAAGKDAVDVAANVAEAA